MATGKFEVHCPHCQTKFQIAHELLGRQVKCGACGKRFDTILPPAPPPPPAPPGDVELAADDLSVLAKIGDNARSRFSQTIQRRFQPATSWLDLFDWRFEKYLTPWIVRLTWIFCLAVAIFLIGVIIVWPFLSNVDLKPNNASSNAQHDNLELRFDDPVWLQDRIGYAFVRVMVFSNVVFALLWIRVILEMVIVLFNIATTLTTIDDRIEKAETNS